MTLHDWIFSVYPENSQVNGRWGILHISVLVFCIAAIIAISFLKSKSEKTKRAVIIALSIGIFVLELSRRIINLSRGYDFEWNYFLTVILPRPWCAISCWMIMLASVLNKKSFYNLAAICAILNALVFFAYPSVGFNHKYILFENVYSIATHSLLLITAAALIILGFTKFKLPPIKEIIGLMIIYGYGFIEIFLLKIEADPLFFMPGGEVQSFLGVNYPLYLVIYVVFLIIYFSLFYILQHIADKQKKAENVEIKYFETEVVH